MSWKFKSSDADGFVCEDTTSPIRVCDVYDSRGERQREACFFKTGPVTVLNGS